MANEDLKAILDERKVEYRKGINRKQLEKLIADTAPDDDAPLVTDDAPDNVEPDTAPAPEAEAEAEAPAPVDTSHGTGTRAIARIQANGAWTCPFCDFANADTLRSCGKCGGVRHGGEVRR